ncbi:MAG: MerR family transcriptional regulator [Oscillospiraceae bacterium]|nr:MerR family transcriptional regulator [Oscillospiraceae bacterium]
MFYSLEEVEKIVGLSRRKIQEYEKEHLSNKPEQERKKSHKLLYTEEHINNLFRLRFYHELGYKIPQIKEKLKDKSSIERNAELSEHIAMLEEKSESLKKLIAVGKIMCEYGIEPSQLISGKEKIIPYDELKKMLNSLASSEVDSDEIDKYMEKTITEEDIEKIRNIFVNLKMLYKLEQEPDSDSAQYLIGDIYHILSKVFSDSIYIFSILIIPFLPGTVYGDEMDELIGEGFTTFLKKSVDIFYYRNKNNPVDMELSNSFETILKLYMEEGFEIESSEIMQQVERAYNFFARVKIMTKDDIVSALRMFGAFFTTSFAAEQTSKENKLAARISYRIIADSINYYCDNI